MLIQAWQLIVAHESERIDPRLNVGEASILGNAACCPSAGRIRRIVRGLRGRDSRVESPTGVRIP